ncbi:MAG: lytic transglycosylase domain-containing protein [Deltaproteobacteria bacterium]|nr:lytic transglycosylase domain-containing protein [Deltaproteobacteria bacterium]
MNNLNRLGAFLAAGMFLGTQGAAHLITERELSKAGDLSFRSGHARELLGKSYDRSIVRNAEWSYGMEHFILSQSEEHLPEAYSYKATQVAAAILVESARHRLDPVFTMSVVNHESRFNPSAVGTHGEIGLMQIKPDTAEWIARKTGIQWLGAKALYEPAYNIKIGTAYLAMLRKKFSSHGGYYLAAYNMGARALKRSTEMTGGLPQEYSSKVMRNYLMFYNELGRSQAPLVAAPRETKRI